MPLKLAYDCHHDMCDLISTPETVKQKDKSKQTGTLPFKPAHYGHLRRMFPLCKMQHQQDFKGLFGQC